MNFETMTKVEKIGLCMALDKQLEKCKTKEARSEIFSYIQAINRGEFSTLTKLQVKRIEKIYNNWLNG